MRIMGVTYVFICFTPCSSSFDMYKYVLFTRPIADFNLIMEREDTHMIKSQLP